MSWLKIGGVAALAIALLATVKFALGIYDKVKAVDAYRACTVAAGTADKALDSCDAVVGARIDAARRAAACEAALKDGQLFAQRAACGEQVKRLIADRDAQAANYRDAQEQLKLSGSETAAAVARAEVRGMTNSERKAANDQVLRAAPRAADGRIRCNADCLRALAGS